MSRWLVPVPESADEAERFTGADPAAAGHGVDRGGVDGRVGVEAEVGQLLFPGRETGVLDAACGAAPVAVLALGREHFGEESLGRSAVPSPRSRRVRWRMVGRRSMRRAWPTAASAAGSVSARRSRLTRLLLARMELSCRATA